MNGNRRLGTKIADVLVEYSAQQWHGTDKLVAVFLHLVRWSLVERADSKAVGPAAAGRYVLAALDSNLLSLRTNEDVFRYPLLSYALFQHAGTVHVKLRHPNLCAKMSLHGGRERLSGVCL